MASTATHGATSNLHEQTDADGAKHEQNGLNGRADSNGKSEDDKNTSTKEKKPSMIAKTWKKLDLDIGTALMMMKYVQHLRRFGMKC